MPVVSSAQPKMLQSHFGPGGILRLLQRYDFVAIRLTVFVYTPTDHCTLNHVIHNVDLIVKPGNTLNACQ